MVALIVVGSLCWFAFFAVRPQDGSGIFGSVNGVIALVVLACAVVTYLAALALLVQEMASPIQRHRDRPDDAEDAARHTLDG
ncbi:hypothetical protein [Pseudooceanicola sp. LIPI14-2-Ac024]|uniref:hypothetical protein n=1 Tax=Pseudooceanicola sp. LIPI14-2-Ac024 TaxID=3344875 RepID=UPI0035D03EAD